MAQNGTLDNPLITNQTQQSIANSSAMADVQGVNALFNYKTPGSTVAQNEINNTQGTAQSNTQETQNKTSSGLLGTRVIDTTDVKNAGLVLGSMVRDETPVYTDPNGDAVIEGQRRYQNLMGLAKMTPTQLATYISSPSVNNTTVTDLRKVYPDLYAAAMEEVNNNKNLENINNYNNNLFNGYNNYNNNKFDNKDVDLGGGTRMIETKDGTFFLQETDKELINQIINKYNNYSDEVIKLYQGLLNTPEINAVKYNISELGGEVMRIQNNINNVADDARERLGSSAPESLVSAYISQQTKQLQKQLNTANISLSVEQDKLKNAIAEADTMIDIYMKGYDYELGALDLAMKYNQPSLIGGSKASTSSSSSSTDITSSGDIVMDLLDGTFGWDFTDTSLKGYGLSNYSKEEIINGLAQSIDKSQLDSLKGMYSEANYNLLAKAWINNNSEEFIKGLGNKSADQILSILKGYGFTSNDTDTINTFIKGFNVDKANAIREGLGIKAVDTLEKAMKNDLITTNISTKDKVLVKDLGTAYANESDVNKVYDEFFKAGQGCKNTDELLKVIDKAKSIVFWGDKDDKEVKQNAVAYAKGGYLSAHKDTIEQYSDLTGEELESFIGSIDLLKSASKGNSIINKFLDLKI